MNLQELPLFSCTPSYQSKLLRQWMQCKAQNPWLLPKLAEMALELKRLGHERYSMKGIFEALRWETRYSTNDLGLKVNNNYTAFAARDLMNQYPELEGFFALREQKPHGNYGQIH
jgi:hypothetical protein